MSKQNYSMNIEGLKTLVKATGMSNEDIAKGCGVSLASLRNYLKGESVPSVEALIKMSEFFSVPMDYLVGRCSIETAEAIENDYESHFMKLRSSAFESYLKGRKSLNKIDGYESPWPYNLVEDIESTYNETVVHESVIDDDRLRGINEALDTLTEREKRIVLRYYRDGLTMDKIGKEEGVTRDRIRQIIGKIIRKLRHPSRYNMIKYGYETSILNDKIVKFRRELEKEQIRLDMWEEEIARRKEEHGEEKGASKKIVESILKTGIVNMDFSVRTYNCLKRRGCTTLGDVLYVVKNGDLTKVRNLGKKSADEVLYKIAEYIGVLYDVDGNISYKEDWVGDTDV